MKYDHKKQEEKWREFWKNKEVFKADDDSKKEKFYCLDMFPYPSGKGLHVGHPRGYVATDVFSNFKRMNGFNVLHPMGWDAFGLPAENYAIKTGTHPRESVTKNIKHFKEQLESIGLGFDWDREVNTTDPDYFKWTQWIFVQMFKKGLAYEDELPINWCPSCKTGLANEEVIDGECERCDTQVEKKDIRQWVLKITDYADRLLEDLEDLDWPESIKEMQRNWIGRSEGARISFEVKESKDELEVFTTRPDTVFGATFMVLAPEHDLTKRVLSGDIEIENKQEVEKYVEEARKKSDLERTELNKEKTGVEVKGLTAINPVSGEEIPVWVADYVLGSYGYGAIMSVPAHDERDFEMAEKYDLEIRPVVEAEELPFAGTGKVINSGEFNGLSTKMMKEKIVQKLEEKDKGERAVNYKLRDWVFSRQRYWGEPIPIIHCEECGTVPVPEEKLPVTLPEVEKYEPTGTGHSPLAAIDEWVNTTCPECGGKAKRETNTMPQWAGSCWYYLRYIDPENSEELIDPKKEDYFMPVDLYVGGAEHAVLHLLYARFWHKFLYDLDVVSTKEPFKKLKNQGLIMADDGTKMSKSKGNVVSPDDIVDEYGADVLRLYEMFVGGFEDEVPWDEEGVVGMRRFLEKVNGLVEKVKEKEPDEKLQSLLHRTIKKVTDDIESFKFNTAISSLMIISNKMKDKKAVSVDIFTKFLQLLAPFAPHFSEELWQKYNEESILESDWPEFDPKVAEKKQITLIVQVNGKLRDKMEVKKGITKEEALKLAKEREKVKKWIENAEIKKEIFVEDKLVNFVT
ncbi:MAG: leucine--tRNA ligase [Patescibacteria group bacterium]